MFLLIWQRFAIERHREGLKEAIRRIKPKKIWIYGGPKEFYPDYDYGYIEPFYVSMAKRRKEYQEKMKNLEQEKIKSGPVQEFS